MKSLSIIIVNWNSGSQLHSCINSIVEFGLPLVNQIIVVDNGSTDGSEIDVENLPKVTLIRAGYNRGFAAACNQGAALASADYLLLLNPDTRLFENSLSTPLDFMDDENNANVGICGIQLVDEQGCASTSAARFPTLRVMAGKILGLNHFLPNIFPAHLMSSSDLRKSSLVDQVIGAFFLIRKNVFDQCYGFDERFFVYFEEVDLSLRVKKLGYSSYFLADATAFHKGGGCSDQVEALRLFYSLRSRILYAHKHYGPVDFTILIFLTLIEFPLRLSRGILRFSLSDVKNVISAYTQLCYEFLRRA